MRVDSANPYWDEGVSEFMAPVRADELRFDYKLIDSDLRGEAERATAEIRERSQRLTTDLIEIGKRLKDMKRIMSGYFTDWLDAEFGYGTTVARQYMAIAERFGDRPDLAALFGSTSLRLASSSGIDYEQVLELAERAKEEGRTVRVAEVQHAAWVRKFRVGIEKEVAMSMDEVVVEAAAGPERGEAVAEDNEGVSRATRNSEANDFLRIQELEAENNILRDLLAELVAAAAPALGWIDEVYPPEVFDGSSGDEGPVQIVAIRENLRRALEAGNDTQTA